jgi:hypothetical protein
MRRTKFGPGDRTRAAAALLLLAAAAAAATFPRPAWAQVPAGAGSGARPEQLQREARFRSLRELELDQRLRANQAVPPGQRVLVDYGAYATLDYLSLQDTTGDDHILREYDGIAYGRVNIDGAQELFLRGRIGWLDFHRGDSFSGRGDEPVDGDLDRGYYRFDLRRFQAAYGGNPDPDFNFTGQVGRDLVYWANGLTMAEVIDGGVLDFELGGLSLEVIGGQTPTRTVDIDSSRPGFDYNTKRFFFGTMLTANAGEHRPFVYFLGQRDYNEMAFRRVGTIPTSYDYNSYYLGVGSTGQLTGRLRYGLEAAYEFGDTLSNSFEVVPPFGSIVASPQHRDNIDAAAFDGRLDYLYADPADTRLSAEAIVATGDPDRGHTTNTLNGNQAKTDDHAFNAFGLINTGLAFAPEVSNIFILRGGYSTFPFHEARPLRRLQAGVDFFVYNKFRKAAPIDETTRDQRFLGVEPDVYVNWQVTSDVTLALRYGVFFPSDNTIPIDKERQFFFAGVTFAF